MELIDARNKSLTAMPSNERLELYFLETGGLRNMELRQLATFLSVARHGSVTEAARRMFVSQPTVSLQIAALEKELGVLLFERQSRGVALTEAGRILMRYASDILTLADQAAQAMGRYIVDIAGTVRVAASTVPADYVLPRALAEFAKLHPAAVVELSRASSGKVAEQVRSYDVEIGFVGSLGDADELEAVPMMEDEIIIIAPPFGEPGDWTDPIGLDQVLASPILCRLAGSGTQKTFDDALRAVGADPERINVRARLESPEAMKAAVAHGAGIAAVSALVAAPAIADGSVRGFRVEGLKMKRKFYMIHHKRKVLSPAAEAFRQHIIDTLVEKVVNN